MAILEELGLAVNVCVDGEPLVEYSSPDPFEGGPNLDINPTAVCNTYIEAATDKEFYIECKILKAQRWPAEGLDRALNYSLRIDGRRHQGKMFSREQVEKGSLTFKMEGNKNHEPGEQVAKLSRFRFATVTPVEITDRATIEQDSSRAKDLGVIRVVIWGSVILSGVFEPHRQSTTPRGLTLAEKSLKGRAISHGTLLSSPVPVPGTVGSRVHQRVKKIEPIACFNFAYRSRSALQAEMIIPRTPSPSVGLDGLDQAEIERLARERLQEIKNERNGHMPPVSVKREVCEIHDGSDAEDDVAVVRRQRFKICKTDEGTDAIDLTDD